MPLSREQVAGLAGPCSVEVDVPEWGDSILVRVIRASEFLEYVHHVRKNPESKEAMVDLVLLAAVDESGERLFDESDRAKVDSLGWNGLKNLTDKVGTINGFDDEEDEGNS